MRGVGRVRCWGGVRLFLNFMLWLDGGWRGGCWRRRRIGLCSGLGGRRRGCLLLEVRCFENLFESFLSKLEARFWAGAVDAHLRHGCVPRKHRTKDHVEWSMIRGSVLVKRTSPDQQSDTSRQQLTYTNEELKHTISTAQRS